MLRVSRTPPCPLALAVSAEPEVDVPSPVRTGSAEAHGTKRIGAQLPGLRVPPVRADAIRTRRLLPLVDPPAGVQKSMAY